MSFSPESNKQDALDQCTMLDHKNVLLLNNRQLSWSAASVIALCFFVFIAGYFLGQKKALERFSSQIDQDSLSDKIATSLYSMYDTTNESEESSDSGDTTETTDSQPPSTDDSEQSEVSSTHAHTDAKQHYYAELVGFSCEKSANMFIARLQKKGITVLSKKLESKSTQGKRVAWYQIVTPSYENQDKLMAVVSKVKHEEHLKGVRIVTC